MNDNNFIVLQGWMCNKLGIKGNDLLIYALIYGFTQDNQNKFTGSLSYIEETINVSKNTVRNSLKCLCDLELIKRKDIFVNNVMFCEYYHNQEKINELVFDRGVQKLIGGVSKIDRGGVSKIDTNNISLKDKEKYIYNTPVLDSDLLNGFINEVISITNNSLISVERAIKKSEVMNVPNNTMKKCIDNISNPNDFLKKVHLNFFTKEINIEDIANGKYLGETKKKIDRIIPVVEFDEESFLRGI